MLTSRHLGPITLQGGIGGGRMDSVVDISGSSIPFSLEIDFPGKFDETVIQLVDLALDGMVELDEMARQAISAAAPQAGSAPERLFEVWRDQETSVIPRDIENFLHLLRLSHIAILPDGGPSSMDRVIIEYLVTELPSSEKLTVRFKERIGPEVDPAPRTT